MKLGFLTAALPDNTLEQAAQWGAESGFQAVEIACWPHEKAARRYAGVTHIDVATLDKSRAAEIRKMLDGYGLTISALAYYPNPLHPDAEHRETVICHLKKVIEAAALLEVPVVGTFVGKDKDKTVPQNFEEYAKIWPPIVSEHVFRVSRSASRNGFDPAGSPSCTWRRMRFLARTCRALALRPPCQARPTTRGRAAVRFLVIHLDPRGVDAGGDLRRRQRRPGGEPGRPGRRVRPADRARRARVSAPRTGATE